MSKEKELDLIEFSREARFFLINFTKESDIESNLDSFFYFIIIQT